MSQGWSAWLERWRTAGLIDADTAARIEAFEGAHAGTSRLRWPILIAIAFGAIMIAGGVLLFVAANWDVLSPAQRFALVLALVSGFHLAGAFTAGRFAQMSEALHLIGTVVLGAGISLAGQIFNLQEHWPGGVMLWALGSGVAWVLLRHTSQVTLFAILAPAWLISEWIAACETIVPWWNSLAVSASGAFLLALAYFTAPSGERPRGARRALMWVGGIAVFIAAIALVEATGVRGSRLTDRVSGTLLATGLAAAFGVPITVTAFVRLSNMIPQALASLWVAVLILVIPSAGSASAYAWWAVGSVGLVAWAVRDGREERVNAGAAFFAMTVFAFYFSQVMDKLGRSASLVGFGLLFLGGGWALERLRRRLVAKAREAQ